MKRVAVSVRGKVKEIGSDMLPLLFEKAPYMNEIYPSAESRKALTVFQIFEGSGEWFDLSKKPIERVSFTFAFSYKSLMNMLAKREAVALTVVNCSR